VKNVNKSFWIRCTALPVKKGTRCICFNLATLHAQNAHVGAKVSELNRLNDALEFLAGLHNGYAVATGS